MTKSRKKDPAWSDVKAKLAGFDRKGLLGLVQDLYALDERNQTFVHTRFGLGADVLEPYRRIIDECLWPDPLSGKDFSVAKAKRAISDYKKAIGEAAGLAELMVFFCEQAAGYCDDMGLQDEQYFSALVRVFEQGIAVANTLAEGERDRLLARLDRVRCMSHEFGYGVGDDLDYIFGTAFGD